MLERLGYTNGVTVAFTGYGQTGLNLQKSATARTPVQRMVMPGLDAAAIGAPTEYRSRIGRASSERCRPQRAGIVTEGERKRCRCRQWRDRKEMNKSAIGDTDTVSVIETRSKPNQ
jgi:hypothetical protein